MIDLKTLAKQCSEKVARDAMLRQGSSSVTIGEYFKEVRFDAIMDAIKACKDIPVCVERLQKLKETC